MNRSNHALTEPPAGHPIFQWKRMLNLAMLLSTAIGAIALLVGAPAQWRLRNLQNLYQNDWQSFDLAPIGTVWRDDPNILIRRCGYSESEIGRFTIYSIDFAMVVHDQVGAPRLLRIKAIRNEFGVHRFTSVQLFLSTTSFLEQDRAERAPSLPPPLLIGSPAIVPVTLAGTNPKAGGLEMEAWFSFKELESLLASDPVSLEWFGAEVHFSPEQLAGLRRMVVATSEFRPIRR